MLIRIRWSKYRADDMPRVQSTALAIASLLAPSALMALTIGVWSLAANLHWTGDFFISNGLFSHWESWLLAAAVMVLLAWLLNRYASSDQYYPK
jgi:hypothetical protein